MNRIPSILVLFLALHAALAQDRPPEEESARSRQPAGDSSTTAPPGVDEFGQDVDLEIRIVLGARSGLAGALPPELIDMRRVLRKQFTYTTYVLWNTIRVVAWPGEQTTAQVVPGHLLVVEPLAADAQRGLVKARVSLYRVPEDIGISRGFAAGEHGAVEVKRRRTERFDPARFPLLSSPMTVTRDEWKAVGGIELFLSADGERLRTTSAQNSGLLAGGNPTDTGSVKRYLIVAVRIAQ